MDHQWGHAGGIRQNKANTRTRVQSFGEGDFRVTVSTGKKR